MLLFYGLSLKELFSCLLFLTMSYADIVIINSNIHAFAGIPLTDRYMGLTNTFPRDIYMQQQLLRIVIRNIKASVNFSRRNALLTLTRAF